MAYKITEVKMSSGGTSVEHIVEVKGLSDSGGAFQETVAQVVNYLKTMVYYVSVGGNTINVKSVERLLAPPYIRTEPDSTQKDNLLSLPRYY